MMHDFHLYVSISGIYLQQVHWRDTIVSLSTQNMLIRSGRSLLLDIQKYSELLSNLSVGVNVVEIYSNKKKLILR